MVQTETKGLESFMKKNDFMGKIFLRDGSNVHFHSDKEMTEQEQGLFIFFNNPIVKKVFISSPDSLNNFEYDDFDIELSERFLDELCGMFSFHGIDLLKETVRLKILFMQKRYKAPAFVLKITSQVCSLKIRNNIQTAKSIDNGTFSLFDKFQIRFMREMANLTIDNSGFHFCVGVVCCINH